MEQPATQQLLLRVINDVCGLQPTIVISNGMLNNEETASVAAIMGGGEPVNAPIRINQSAPAGGKVPPQNLDAEMSLLGAILIDEEVLADVSDKVCMLMISMTSAITSFLPL